VAAGIKIHRIRQKCSVMRGRLEVQARRIRSHRIYAEKFAEEVERLSDGTMLISVYPNSVLGGDRELLESCKEGDIPFVVQNTGTVR